jgi:hypothetical protein
MKGIDSLYENSLKSDKARIAAQEKLLDLKRKEKEIAESLNRMGVSTTPSAQTPSIQKPEQPQDESRFQGLLKNFLTATTAAAIINGALNISRNMVRAEGRESRNEAIGIQSAFRPVAEAMQGRGYETAFFGEERARALQMAEKQMGRESILGRLQALNPFGSAAQFGGMAAGAGIGAKVGAGVGAGFGFGFGAIPGAVIGGLVGGVGGLLAGSATDERNRLALFDPTGYEKLMTAEGMKNFEQLEAAERAKDPRKVIAAEFMARRGRDLLQAQRAMGAGTQFQDLQSSLMSNMTFGGGAYSLDQILANQSAMMQAGASSADLRGNLAGFASAAQQFGVSSAASVMGRISAAGNQQGTTDDAFARIMTIAVKNGVDLSKMPQELNRFVSLASELATQGGGFSQKAAEVFAAGMTEFSAVSMQGAKSFTEQFQGRAGTAGGLEGQIGYGFLLGEEAEGILGAESYQKMKENNLTSVLNTMTAEELEKNPTLLKGYAKQLGTTPEKLKELVSKKDLSKNVRTARQKEALSKLGEAIKGKSAEEIKAFYDTEEGAMLYSEAFTESRRAMGESFRPDAMGRSAITGLSRLMVGDQTITSEDVEKLRKDMSGPRGGQLEAIERSRAMGDQMQVENLSKFVDQMGKTAESFDKNSAAFEAAFGVFIRSAKEGGDAMSKYKDEILKAIQELQRQLPQNPVAIPSRTQPKSGASN